MANGLGDFVGRDVVLDGFYGGITNAIFRNQEKEQQRAEAERKRQLAAQKELSDQISKINPSGLRTADVADYNKLYQEMKDSAISAYNATDAQTRMAAEAQVKEKANQLFIFVDQSKQLGKTEQELGTWLGNDPYTAGGDNRKRYRGYVGTPLMKLPPDVYNRINWIKPPDANKIDKDLNTLADDLLKRADATTVTEAGVLGGKPGDWYQDVREIPIELYGKALLDKYNADGEFRALVQQQYPDVPVENAIMDLAQAKAAQGRLTKASDRKFSAAYRPRSSGGSGGASAGVGEIAYNIPVNLGGNRVSATRGVDVTSSNVVVPNREAVDAETGQIVNLGEIKAETGVRQGQITGILEIPALGNAFGTGNNEVVEYQVQIPNEGYILRNGMELAGPKNFTKTYYIRRDLLPEGAANIKAIQQAAAKFDAARGTSQSQQNSVSSQPTDATISVAEQMRRAAQKK